MLLSSGVIFRRHPTAAEFFIRGPSAMIGRLVVVKKEEEDWVFLENENIKASIYR